MRKKLFAIVMSMTMVASFMPSMAFAANTNDTKAGHTYYTYGTDYTIVDGKAVAKVEANQKAIDKCVKVIAAPTCTTKGKVELTCKTKLPDDVACDQTKTEEIKALKHSYERVNMSLEEYAAQRVAQKEKTGYFINEGTAKAWVKTQKNSNVCYVLAMRCKNCGSVVGCDGTITPAQAVTENGAKSKLVKHGYDKATAEATCAEKVLCSNVGCEEMVANTGHADHVLDATKATTTKIGCGGIEVTKTPCKNCEYVAVSETGTANCVEFVGQIANESIKYKTTTSADGNTETTLYLADGKVIRTEVREKRHDDIEDEDYWVTTSDVLSPGYFFDEENYDYFKADTTVVVGGVEKYGYTCKHCGLVSALGNEPVAVVVCNHEWKKVTEDATCEAPAQEYMVCTECGKYKKVTEANDVPGSATKVTTAVEGSKKLGHNYVATKVDGDCHDTDKYTIECTRENCPHKKLDDVNRTNYTTLDKGASLYLDPTDGSVGLKNIVGSQELPYIADNTANNHKFTKKVTIKAATCTNNEVVGYVCDTCGKINIHSASVVPSSKLAHEIEKVDTPATCVMTAGSIEKCKNCDYKKVLVEAKAIEGGKHAFDKWVVTKDSTVFEEGVKTLTCSACGTHDDTKTVIAKKTVAKASNTVKAGKKKLTVKSSAANATGYRVYYKKSTWKNYKYVTVNATSVNKTIKNLTKGKKYYVKVRAFAKNDAGDVVWGAYSATKSVKVK